MGNDDNVLRVIVTLKFFSQALDKIIHPLD